MTFYTMGSPELKAHEEGEALGYYHGRQHGFLLGAGLILAILGLLYL